MSACVSALLLLLAACAGTRPAIPPTPAAPPPAPEAPHNFEVRVTEVVERADLDGLSYADVFIDGAAAGRTNIAPRSQEKRWSGRVEAGNRPVRVEIWVLPGTGEWSRLPDAQQPRERFVRLEGPSRAVLVLRRHPSGSYDFGVTRQAL
ncbi:MAG: hypothetical protein HY553_13605 [Elusimicrobia bacterium]|nr:hypothetical protein [Elusimicrobiota bacterium]